VQELSAFQAGNCFEAQSDEYKESVLPKSVKAEFQLKRSETRLGKYLGDYGEAISIEKFGHQLL